MSGFIGSVVNKKSVPSSGLFSLRDRFQVQLKKSLTLTASTADDQATCSDATYTQASRGLGTLSLAGSSATALGFGQVLSGGTYSARQLFLEFDYYSYMTGLGYTAAQVSASIILSATITTTASAEPDSNFTARARAYDFGSSITTGDFIDGRNLRNYPLLAHFAVTTGTVDTTTMTWTSDALAAYISKTSTPTRIVLHGQNQETEVAPTNFERVNIYAADSGTAAYRPKLTISCLI